MARFAGFGEIVPQKYNPFRVIRREPLTSTAVAEPEELRVIRRDPLPPLRDREGLPTLGQLARDIPLRPPPFTDEELIPEEERPPYNRPGAGMRRQATPYTSEQFAPEVTQSRLGVDIADELTSLLPELVREVGAGAVSATIGVPQVAVGLADIVTLGHAGKLLEQAGYKPGEAQRILMTGYSEQTQAEYKRLAEAEGLVDQAITALTSPRVLAHSLAESAPLMLMGGLIGKGITALAPRVAGALGLGAGALGEGIVSAGASAEQIRQESPTGLITPGQAALSVSSGAVTAVLGQLGHKIANRLDVTDIDTLFAAAAKSKAAEQGLLKEVLYGAIEEGGEELLQSISEQAHSNLATGRPLTEGVVSSGVLGMLAGNVMGAGAQVYRRATALPTPPPEVMPDVLPGELPPTRGEALGRGTPPPGAPELPIPEAQEPIGEPPIPEPPPPRGFSPEVPPPTPPPAPPTGPPPSPTGPPPPITGAPPPGAPPALEGEVLGPEETGIGPAKPAKPPLAEEEFVSRTGRTFVVSAYPPKVKEGQAKDLARRFGAATVTLDTLFDTEEEARAYAVQVRQKDPTATVHLVEQFDDGNESLQWWSAEEEVGVGGRVHFRIAGKGATRTGEVIQRIDTPPGPVYVLKEADGTQTRIPVSDTIPEEEAPAPSAPPPGAPPVKALPAVTEKPVSEMTSAEIAAAATARVEAKRAARAAAAAAPTAEAPPGAPPAATVPEGWTKARPVDVVKAINLPPGLARGGGKAPVGQLASMPTERGWVASYESPQGPVYSTDAYETSSEATASIGAMVRGQQWPITDNYGNTLTPGSEEWESRVKEFEAKAVPASELSDADLALRLAKEVGPFRVKALREQERRKLAPVAAPSPPPGAPAAKEKVAAPPPWASEALAVIRQHGFEPEAFNDAEGKWDLMDKTEEDRDVPDVVQKALDRFNTLPVDQAETLAFGAPLVDETTPPMEGPKVPMAVEGDIKWSDRERSVIWAERKSTVQAKTLAAGEQLTLEQAEARQAEWKAIAKNIGATEDHSNDVIFSLFDHTGEWSKPWHDAGYDVRTYDLKRGDDLQEFFPMGDIMEAKEEGKNIVGVLAAPPCTSFAVSGARWWATQHDQANEELLSKKYGWQASRSFDTPLEYANALVALTELFIEEAAPEFFAVENPVGRITEQNKLPKATLSFDPYHFGDAYTKKTLLWGTFNTNLPTAKVDPILGSYMSVLRGDDPAQKAERSITPEGFAYAFFIANQPTARQAVEAPPKAARAQPTYFDVGERVIADEGVGWVHIFDWGTRNVKIALEPDGTLTKWIPIDRVRLAPAEAPAAEEEAPPSGVTTKAEQRAERVKTEAAKYLETRTPEQIAEADARVAAAKARRAAPPPGAPAAKPAAPAPAPAPDADLEARKAALKAKRDEVAKKMRARASTLRSGVDPEDVVLMVEMMQLYIADGLIEFERAWRQFKKEYRDLAERYSEHFEEVWDMLQGEQKRVADVVETKEDEEDEGDRDLGPGRVPELGAGAAVPAGAPGIGPLGAVSTDLVPPTEGAGPGPAGVGGEEGGTGRRSTRRRCCWPGTRRYIGSRRSN